MFFLGKVWEVCLDVLVNLYSFYFINEKFSLIFIILLRDNKFYIKKNFINK